MGKMIERPGNILWLCLTILVSCGRPIRSTRDSFQYTQYCYNGNYTGLDTLLNIDGYYTFEDSYIEHRDLSAIPTVVRSPYNCYFSGHGDFIGSYSAEAGGGLWGRYVICHDTIMAQFIEPPRGMSWSKGEIWFKIINKNTLRRIGFKWYTVITEADIETFRASKSQEYNTLGHLSPHDTTPDPNTSWLKKRKWFWCDKNQFEIWKKKTSNSSSSN